MRIGYARVSTQDQNPALQLDALRLAGCEKVYREKASGADHKSRPVLQDLLSNLRPKDELVVWRLDRLGRSLVGLIDLIELLEQKQVEFISLQDKIDTTTPMGRLMFHIAGAFGEYDRNVIRERTHAGLAAARARGRVGGRRPLPEAIQKAIAAHVTDQGESVGQFCRSHGIGRSTYYRYLESSRNGEALKLPRRVKPKPPRRSTASSRKPNQ